MSRKTIGYILIAVGVIIAVVALAADALGIGGSPGIGWKQLVGAAVGVVILLVGIWQASSKQEAKS